MFQMFLEKKPLSLSKPNSYILFAKSVLIFFGRGSLILFDMVSLTREDDFVITVIMFTKTRRHQKEYG